MPIQVVFKCLHFHFVCALINFHVTYHLYYMHSIHLDGNYVISLVIMKRTFGPELGSYVQSSSFWSLNLEKI